MTLRQNENPDDDTKQVEPETVEGGFGTGLRAQLRKRLQPESVEETPPEPVEEPDPEFEERSIVLPTSNAAKAATAPATHPRRPFAADDPTGAYLAALDALAADGRWPRRQHETPAAHLGRVRGEGLITASFGRLTAAYELARYSPRPLPDHERRRAGARLQALRGWLRRS